MQRKLFEHGVTFARELDQHAAAVVAVVMSLHEATRHGTIDQLDGAVVLDQQPVGDIADGCWLLRAGEAAQGEEQLVLLGFEAEGV
jgi:hypothetical protein